MNKNIIIPNPKELDRKIAKIKKDGVGSIHFIADFNKTFTPAYLNGKKVPSLISHLRTGSYLAKDYSSRAQALYDYYRPIEISRTISFDEKKAKMLEWWLTHYKLLVECGLNEETIKKVVEDMLGAGFGLRNGAKEVLKNLHEKGIPLVVMSGAGIGNMILKFLDNQNLLFDNLFFIGNTLQFDKRGRFLGVEDDKIIHVLNKKEVEIKNLPVYEKIKNRPNIFLLGDSIEDSKITDGYEYKTIIKIGFLNDEEENSLEEFKNNFDVIILNDSDMDFVNQLLNDL
jgi:5'-nucleotidase